MSLDKLRKSLGASPIVKIGDYDYFVNPISDGIPSLDPSILAEVIGNLREVGDFDCDLIVAPESMGIPLAVPLSLELGIPYCIVRKKSYGLPGEVQIEQTTGYSKSKMYINGISKGDRVTLVDSVVSSGGTLKAVVQGIRGIGAKVVDVMVVIEKGGGKQRLENELGIPIKSLIRIEVTSKGVKIMD
jgi:adenine phosphoribosyltransferase